MKELKPFLLYSLIVFLSWTTAKAQSAHCTNLSFELGNFDGWTGYLCDYQGTGHGNTPPPKLVWTQVPIPTARRHVILPNDGVLPPRFKYLARLGDIRNPDPYNSDPPLQWAQRLTYNMTIDSANALLIVKYTFTFRWREAHGGKQPQFSFILFDQKGDTIHDCANYAVNADDNTLSWHAIAGLPIGPGMDVMKEKYWSTVGANLLKYYGQTVTLEFVSANDLADGDTYGLAFLVGECQPLVVKVSYCTGDSAASLKAPDAFEKYRWTDSSGTVVDTIHQILKVKDPVDGSTFTCAMTSWNGCTIEQKFKINRYEFTTDFSSIMLDCKSNTVQMNNLCTSKCGALNYNWDFGGGSKSTENNAQFPHTFATSGLHDVTLIVSKPPSTCVDTLKKTIESFSPPLIGITGDSTFCKGLSGKIKAYGAWDYTWNLKGYKADSVVVNPPGGTYWLIGRSSNGCVSDTIYKTVTEDPDWQLLDQSDTTRCPGDRQTILAVIGAQRYKWDTRDTTSTIIIWMPGNYTVTGTNSKGCKKKKTFNVKEYPYPAVDFKTSSTLKDNNQNLVTCIITAENGVSYLWDMGDGTTETGATIEHTYTLSSKIQSYTISLTATNNGDCSKSASTVVDLVPIVSRVYPPNAFSPNAPNDIDRVFCLVSDGMKSEGYHFVVISRWNDIVYETRNVIKGWDGRMKNGNWAPAGNYVWILEYIDNSGKAHRQTGTVTLVF